MHICRSPVVREDNGWISMIEGGRPSFWLEGSRFDKDHGGRVLWLSGALFRCRHVVRG
jgi:hypothetical protein